MYFTSGVLNISDLNKPPDGWKVKLTLRQYEKMDEERKKYYKPLYARYRTKKVRDYDFEDGSFVGWRPIDVGIGEPTGYKYVGYFAARLIDQVNSSNILMERILHKDRKNY